MLAYVVGVALGDGNLSNPNGRAARLRITCDAKYPRLARRVARSIGVLFPTNRVAIVRKGGNCFDVSCYSQHWESLLGWQVDRGSKIAQSVAVPDWIRNDQRYTRACLRGLIETDGTIYFDRGYPMVMFANACETLARDVGQMMMFLGFSPRMYKVEKNRQRAIYRIRLSKRVAEFVALVRPMKS